jgi:hypothetical protein
MESAMKVHVNPPQSVADDLALTAQKYVGYFTGHPTHARQWPVVLPGSVTIDKEPWREPVVVFDKCLFCKDMTDEVVLRRIEGYQAAIDKEVLGRKWGHFQRWAEANGYSVSTLNYYTSVHWPLWRRFIVETQDVPREWKREWLNTDEVRSRPNGWNVKAFPLVDLPFRLKRKLCVEWNHVYTAWMTSVEVIQYDFETRIFYIEKEEDNA